MPDRTNAPMEDEMGDEMIPPEKPEKIDPAKVLDPDDLVHRGAAGRNPVSPQADADDTVHRFPPKSSPDQDKLKDPDDLVHGG